MADRLRRRVVAACTERLGYKGAAVFFAAALWVAARIEEPDTRLVAVRFAPVLDGSVRLDGPPPTVRALVVGPTRELLELAATPPTLRHAFGPGTPDRVTLDLRPSDLDLPPSVEGVTVRDVEPHAITLRFTTAPAARGGAP